MAQLWREAAELHEVAELWHESAELDEVTELWHEAAELHEVAELWHEEAELVRWKKSCWRVLTLRCEHIFEFGFRYDGASRIPYYPANLTLSWVWCLYKTIVCVNKKIKEISFSFLCVCLSLFSHHVLHLIYLKSLKSLKLSWYQSIIAPETLFSTHSQ